MLLLAMGTGVVLMARWCRVIGMMFMPMMGVICRRLHLLRLSGMGTQAYLTGQRLGRQPED